MILRFTDDVIVEDVVISHHLSQKNYTQWRTSQGISWGFYLYFMEYDL